MLFCLNLQEKEYKEALDLFNEKSKEKAQLVSALKEVYIYIVYFLNSITKVSKRVLSLYVKLTKNMLMTTNF